MPEPCVVSSVPPSVASAAARICSAGKSIEATNYGEVARLLRRKRPDLAGRVIQAAEEALTCHLILPGTMGRPFFVGNPPDWFANPFGDNEYVWSLNRMGHWLALMRAHALTGDDRYTERVKSELSDWIARCPCPEIDFEPAHWIAPWGAAGPWRILEIGIRSYGSWKVIQEYLAETGLLGRELTSEYVRSSFEHARALSLVSPRIWPNADHNHFIMEMLGLLSIAKRMPELDETGAWSAVATEQLGKAIQKQIVDGGAQLEGAPHYHHHCVHLISKAFQLAEPDSFPATLRELFHAAVDHAVFTTRADFRIIPVGDSDPDPCSIESCLLGYLTFKEERWLRIACNLAGRSRVEQYLWDMIWDVPGSVELLEALPAEPQPVAYGLTHHAPGVNQAVLRSGWNRDDAVVMLSCMPMYQGHLEFLNGHTHIDPGSFDYSAYGRSLLADPGRYTYREDEDRYEFKRAASHNCLLIDDADPFEYANTWRFRNAGKSHLSHVWNGPLFVAASCEHRHYAGIVCRRMVILTGRDLLLVVDEVEGQPEEAMVQRYFHFDTVHVESEDDKVRARYLPTDDQDGTVFLSAAVGGRCRVDLLPGRISTAVDVAHESRRVRVQSPANSAQPLRLLAAFATSCQESGAVKIEECEGGWIVQANGAEIQITVTSFDQPPVIGRRNSLQ